MRRFLLATLLVVSATTMFAIPSPYLTQVIGDSVVTKVSQDVTAVGDAGTADTTFAANGAINFNTAYSYANTEDTGKAILRLSNGDMFIASDNDTDSKIIKIDCDGNAITAFGSSGIVTVSAHDQVKHMLVDHSNQLIVIGGLGASDSKEGWVKRYNLTNGTEDTSFDIEVADADHARLDICGMVVQQSLGRILVSGKKYNGTADRGAIIAYKSSDGSVDTTFGVNGIYYTDNIQSIWEIALDSSDRIYFTYNNDSNNTWIKRLDVDGKNIDSGFDTESEKASNVTNNADTHVILDENGDVVMATVDSSDSIIMTRWSAATGNIMGSTLTLTTGTTGLSADTKLKGLTVDTAGKFILVGHVDTTTDTVFVMRVLADLSGLDTSFNNGGGNDGVQTANGGMTGNNLRWSDSVVAEDGRIYVIGGTFDTGYPFLMRLYGDQYVAELDASVAAATEGALDTTLNPGGTLDTDAAFDLATLDGSLSGLEPIGVRTLTSGGHFITLSSSSGASKLIRIDSDNTLNTTFNIGGATPGIAADLPQGANVMFLTDAGEVLVAGVDATTAWLKRYLLTGEPDQTFGEDGLVEFGDSAFYVDDIAEQTHGRILVSGWDDNGNNGVIYAFNPVDGSLDTTFATNGVYSTGNDLRVKKMSVDTFNRIIISHKVLSSSDMEIQRLLPHGSLDETFNATGKLTVIANAAGSWSVAHCIDSNGDIVSAAVVSGSVKVIKHDNATGTEQYSVLDLGISNGLGLYKVVPVSDGKVLVAGYRTGANDMFVARITNAGALDSTFGTSGIMDFKVTTTGPTSRVSRDIGIRADGRISIVGYEVNGGTSEPFLVRAYGEPYSSAISQTPGLQPQGLPDEGLVGAIVDDQGFYSGKLFYLESGSDKENLLQRPRAIAMQGDKYIIAADGQSSAGDTESKMFLARFDLDGQLDTSFSTDGWDQLTHTYKNEYINAMHLFEDGGIQKAILAGYITSGSPLNVTQSMLVQYDITNALIDSTFGGLHNAASGMAVAHAQQFNHVARQSDGRVIASGLDQSGNGVLCAYTKLGKLDTNFGSYGKYTVESNATGVYNHVIDHRDRIIVVYDDNSQVADVACILPDGSGLDTSFGTNGKVANGDRIGTILDSENIAVAIDNDNKIIVAAVNGASNDQVTVRRYYADGTTDGTSLTINSTSLSSTLLSIAKVIIDNDNKIYLFLTDNDPDDDFIVVRISADMSGMDTTFNPNGATPGRFIYRVRTGSTVRELHDAVIHDDGRITVVGSEE